jgi:hypothetical protein
MSLPISDEHNSRHDGELAVPCGRSKRSIPPETILAVYTSVSLAGALKGSVYEKRNLPLEVRLKVMLLRYSERLDQTSHKHRLKSNGVVILRCFVFLLALRPGFN